MSLLDQIDFQDDLGLWPRLGRLVALCGIFGAAVLFVVHLFVALAIGADARRRVESNKPLALLGPLLWFWAAWFGSVFIVALYWVMHYSSLRHPDEFPGRS